MLMFLARLLLIILSSAVVASPTAAGTGTVSDPYTSLADANAVQASGQYYFNRGSGLFQADIDTSEGGGWVLVLQSVHQSGAGHLLTFTSTAVLGVSESGGQRTAPSGGGFNEAPQ